MRERPSRRGRAAIGLPVALQARDPFWLMPANNTLVIAGVAQTDHVGDPGRVLRGVTQILWGSIEQQFVTAATP